MNEQNKKLEKTLVVRITTEQYTRLLETIILERKKDVTPSINNSDKSKIVRQMIDKYTTRLS